MKLEPGLLKNSNANSGNRGWFGLSRPGTGYFREDGEGGELKNRLLRNVSSGAFGK